MPQQLNGFLCVNFKHLKHLEGYLDPMAGVVVERNFRQFLLSVQFLDPAVYFGFNNQEHFSGI